VFRGVVSWCLRYVQYLGVFRGGYGVFRDVYRVFRGDNV